MSADPERLVGVDEIEVVLDRGGALKVKDDPGFSLGFGVADIRRAPDQDEIVTLANEFEPTSDFRQGDVRRRPSPDGRSDDSNATVLVQAEIAFFHQQWTNGVDDNRVLVQSCAVRHVRCSFETFSGRGRKTV